MKLRVPNDLLLIDVCCILLIVVIMYVSSTIARIALGLPVLLFFPGYTFVEAVFAKKLEISSVERISLSFGFSIALVPLMGLVLNYTPWGIALVPVLSTGILFIFIMSNVALIRRAIVRGEVRLIKDLDLKIPGWEGGVLNKSLIAVTALAFAGTIGVLTYAVALPKVGEKFTEFYMLGNNGKADGYPSDFTMSSGLVVDVSYDGGQTFISSDTGRVTLGLINHEQKEIKYNIVVQIDAERVDILYNGKSVSQIDQIDLLPGQKWEQEVGFAPRQPGEKQKVEFDLFENSESVAAETLHLWVNAKD